MSSPAENARAEVTKIVERIRRSAEQRARGVRITVATRTLLLPLTGLTDYTALRRQLEEISQDLRALADITSDALAEVDESELRRAEQELFSEVWWGQRQRMIASAAAPDEAWVRTFAEALLADQYDICRRLTTPGRSAVPSDPVLLGDAQAAASGLVRGRLDRVVPLLRSLLDGPCAPALHRPSRVAVMTLLVRSLLSCETDRAEARRRLDVFFTTESGLLDDERAALHLVQGEHLLAETKTSAARTAFEIAARLAPDDPQPRVGLGMVAEATGDWFKAQDCYDAAAAVAAAGHRFGRRFAPTPGNLCWRVSRRLHLAGRLEPALTAVEESLRRGLSGGDRSPEYRALTLKGRLLRDLRRPREAAAAYYQAALRYQDADDYEGARSCLEKACEDDDETPVYHWLLAEVLRALARSMPATKRPELLKRARDTWRQGSRAGRPGPEESWAYITVGLIKYAVRELEGEARTGGWEAAVKTQHALLLDPQYGPSWSFLATIHNRLGNSRTALLACDRALALNRDDEMADQERVTALLQLGRLKAAGEALERQRRKGPSSTEVYYLLLRGEPESALRVLDALPVDDEPRYRMARALCLQRAGRDDEAHTEAEWLWTNPDFDSVPFDQESIRALAGYVLGRYDDAEAICERMLTADVDGMTLAVLGLARMGRADEARSDLRRGRADVLSGVATTRDFGDMAVVTETMLPELVRRLERERSAGAGAVRDVLAEAVLVAQERRQSLADEAPTAAEELREALVDGRDADRDEVRRRACHGGLGLLALTNGPEAEALGHFRPLIEADRPEGRAALGAVARALQDAADDLVGGGEVAQARDGYSKLLAEVEAAGERSRTTRVAALRAGLRWRAALASVELGDVPRAVHLLAGSRLDDLDGVETSTLQQLGQRFVRDVGSYWRLVDGLAEIRAHESITSATAAQIDVLSAALHLDLVFQLRRSDADPAATFPLTNPVVVRLGGPGPDLDAAQRLLHEMRRRIDQLMGVTVPGIKVVAGSAGYEVSFEGVPVLRGDPGVSLDGVVARLEGFVVANLARLFGPDDVVNWAATAGGELGPQARALLGDSEFRLAVHRVLQFLLREGVPLTDRAHVLDVVSAAVAQSRCDAARALRTARAALVPAPEGPVRDLPAELATALEAGLVPGLADPGLGLPLPAGWQLDRPSASALTQKLWAWWREGDNAAVVVAVPELRPVVWRLLALGGERPTVLTREELHR
ncbi:hypothetical protein [Actinoplanes sp. M2I2]|uniref:hypothetical protein n=1 Tax=Actinoplanes sp. M2I2 TaxID=1734444 RepID=UPI00201FB740|nr:hypothetical protein [Actinoplanes sp. M2I2]